MKWVIDRIESDIAVIEVGNECIDIPTKCLPIGVKEGDVLSLKYPINNQCYQYLKRSEQLYRLAQTFLQ